MSDPVEFFFGSRKSVVERETLEISHPDFSDRFLFVQGNRDLTATLETGEVVTFQRMPMRIRKMASRGDLDYGIGVDLGDLGDRLPDEIDRVRVAGTLRIRPIVIYRAYRSDDLASPMIGPLRLEAQAIARTREGASFDAGAPYLNLSKTGELYTLDRFPMLRGFL
jgi:hypothetical protein